jgi:hypothetical protein
MAYAVSQRTKEIGIRTALVARPSHVLAVVLRQFSFPVVGGLLVGVGGAAALSQMAHIRQLLATRRYTRYERDKSDGFPRGAEMAKTAMTLPWFFPAMRNRL